VIVELTCVCCNASVHAKKKKQAGDGVFSVDHDGFIKLVNLKSNTTTNLVQISDLMDVSLVDGFARA
jgi:hypothetical protein